MKIERNVDKNGKKVRKSNYSVRVEATIQCYCEECGHRSLLLKGEAVVCENCGNHK